MPTVEVLIEVAAPPEAVWRTVTDIESYGEMMGEVREVKILSQSGRERVSSWSVLLKGSVLEWTELEVLDEAAHTIDFEQVEGDLEFFNGRWFCRATASGSTEVGFTVEFDIGIPLLADMLNPVASRALRDNSQRMLEQIERRVSEQQP